MNRLRASLIWPALATAVAVPVLVAADSPQLEWRRAPYIIAGFAGIAAMVLLLIQPLLAGGYLPGLPKPRGRRVHRWIGSLLVLSILVHVGGLWLTSAPDVIDALLFASPTPFSVWGVVAMWAVFASAVLAIWRRRLRLHIWRIGHTVLVVITVIGSVVHAMLIEGPMGTVSKAALCALAVLATGKTIHDLRVWALKPRPRNGTKP